MTASSATRAAIYCRVSTRAQAEEGFSLAGQRKMLVAIAKKRGWSYTVFEDGGKSGETIEKRPQMQRLLLALEEGHFDVVLVQDDSRLARDDYVAAVIYNHLKKAGVRLVTASGEHDLNDPSGLFAAKVLSAASSFEQALRTRKTAAGHRSAAKAGFWTGGPPPYGFKIVPTGAKHKRLAIYEREATVIRTATSLVLDEGCSTWQAASRLNALGQTPRRAVRWSHITLRRMLLSPTISGDWSYGKHKGTHHQPGSDPFTIAVPAIITLERHKALITALDSTSTVRRAAAFYLLSRGHLKGPCGGTFHGVTRRDRRLRQYRCWNSRPEAVERCECLRLNAEDIENRVWRAILDLLSAPARLRQMAEDYMGTREQDVVVERDQLSVIDGKIASTERALGDAYAERFKGRSDEAALRIAIERLESDLTSLRHRRDQVMAWHARATDDVDRMRSLRRLASLARKRLVTMTPEEKSMVLRLLDVKVGIPRWTECAQCFGKGRVADGVHQFGHVCADCHGARRRPDLRIEGVVFERLADTLSMKAGDGYLTASAPRPSTCSRR